MGHGNPEMQMQVLALYLLKQKLKKDKVNIIKVLTDKLSRIGNNQAKLRNSFLIGNVLKNVQCYETEESSADYQVT
jgi:hypothetical protein